MYKYCTGDVLAPIWNCACTVLVLHTCMEVLRRCTAMVLQWYCQGTSNCPGTPPQSLPFAACDSLILYWSCTGNVLASVWQHAGAVHAPTMYSCYTRFALLLHRCCAGPALHCRCCTVCAVPPPGHLKLPAHFAATFAVHLARLEAWVGRVGRPPPARVPLWLALHGATWAEISGVPAQKSGARVSLLCLWLWRLRWRLGSRANLAELGP